MSKKQEEIYRITLKGYLSVRFGKDKAQAILESIEYFCLKRHIEDGLKGTPALIFDGGGTVVGIQEAKE